jgi:hypothetical protein
MPLIHPQSNILAYEKNHIKYVKTREDIEREHTKDVFKKTRDDERKEQEEERNERERQQYAYYIGLYEKYGTKDWDSVKIQMDYEKRKAEEIRKENQKKIDSENAKWNMFGPQRKKDMYGMGSFADRK